MNWNKKAASLLLAGVLTAALVPSALAIEHDDFFGYQDWYDVLPEGAASGYVPVSKTEYEISYNGSAVQQEQDIYDTDSEGKLIKYTSVSRYSNGYEKTDEEITYTYDGTGHLSSMQRNYGNLYETGQISYDASGNIVREVFQQYTQSYHSDVPVSTYTYDYKYDNQQNLIERIEQNGRRASITTYKYDNNGNLIQMAESDEIKTFEYDTNNRLVREITQEYDDRDSDIVTYEYDNLGRLIRETEISDDDHDAEQTIYEYNNQGQLVSKIDTDGDSYTYEYDAVGNLVKENSYDGRRLEEYTSYTYKKIGSPNPDTSPTPDTPVQPDNPTTQVGQFTDVLNTSWYAKAVQYVYDAGLMSGTSVTTFEPDAALNRAMIAQILYTKAGNPNVSDLSSYSDVNPSQWYAKAVAWAKQVHAVSGYQDGTFQPNKNVTRQELAQMLYADEGKPKVSGSLNFSDASQAWAKDALLWATQKGIISGTQKNGSAVLDPQGSATRAQAAAMVMQYMNKK